MPDDRNFPQLRSDHLNHWSALGAGDLAFLASQDAHLAARPAAPQGGIVGWNRSPRHPLLYPNRLERIAFFDAHRKQAPRSILWTGLYRGLSATHRTRLAEAACVPLGYGPDVSS